MSPEHEGARARMTQSLREAEAALGRARSDSDVELIVGVVSDAVASVARSLRDGPRRSITPGPLAGVEDKLLEASQRLSRIRVRRT